MVVVTAAVARTPSAVGTLPEDLQPVLAVMVVVVPVGQVTGE